MLQKQTEYGSITISPINPLIMLIICTCIMVMLPFSLVVHPRHGKWDAPVLGICAKLRPPVRCPLVAEERTLLVQMNRMQFYVMLLSHCKTPIPSCALIVLFVLSIWGAILLEGRAPPLK